MAEAEEVVEGAGLVSPLEEEEEAGTMRMRTRTKEILRAEMVKGEVRSMVRYDNYQTHAIVSIDL